MNRMKWLRFFAGCLVHTWTEQERPYVEAMARLKEKMNVQANP